MKLKYFILTLIMFQYASSQDRKQCGTLIDSAIKLWQKEQYSAAITTLQKVKKVAENNGWYDVLFDANNNLGANHHSLLMHGDALNYYLESYTIALSHLQPKEEMVVLNNIAIIYSEEGNYVQAKNYFERALLIARANKNKIKEGLYSLNLAILAADNNEYQIAEKYILNAIPLISGDSSLIITAKLTRAEIMINKGMPARARKELLQLISNKDISKYQKISLLHVMALSYFKEKDFKKFSYYAKQVLANNPDDEVRKEIFHLLSVASHSSGDIYKAYYYKDSLISIIESLEKKKNLKLLKGNEVKLNVQEYKNKILVLDEQRKTQKAESIFAVCLVLALATIAILIYRNLVIKYKQKKLLAETVLKNTELELARQKNHVLTVENKLQEKQAHAKLEEERLKMELEVRNKQLSAKALYLFRKHELIEQIMTFLNTLPDSETSLRLKQQIREIKYKIDREDEWKSFVKHLEETTKAFINSLKETHPGLTANDIRFLSYIHINMSTREIASLLKITDDACRKRKERMKVKLGVDKNESLYDYLLLHFSTG